jgi:hypothetical protein
MTIIDDAKIYEQLIQEVKGDKIFASLDEEDSRQKHEAGCITRRFFVDNMHFMQEAVPGVGEMISFGELYARVRQLLKEQSQESPKERTPEQQIEELRAEFRLAQEAVFKFSRYIRDKKINGYDATSVVMKYLDRTAGYARSALEKRLEQEKAEPKAGEAQ